MPPSLAGLLRRLVHSLTEPQGAAPGSANGEPPRQISSVGQILLSSLVILAGLISFHITRTVYEYLNASWQPCLSLPKDGSKESAQQQAKIIPNSQISRNESLLMHQYRQSEYLAEQLASATPGQQIRLNQQLRVLTHGLDSFCRISNHFRSQQAGLLLVGTWSASVAALTLILIAPQGIQNTSRAERTIFISTVFVLGISISLLSFLDPKNNIQSALNSYNNYNNLMQTLSSSLANQQLLLSSDTRLPAQGQALANPARVAALIRDIDLALMAIPNPTITINGSFAETTFNRIIKDSQQPPGGEGPDTPKKAAFPSHPSPP